MRNIAAPLIKSLIFIAVTALATTLLAISITNSGVGATERYTAKFLDATSLNVGDDVRISGVRVGQVESLDIGDRNRAVVGFSLDQGRRLPADVRAVIKYRNMVGQRYVALERGTTGTREQLPQGAEIPLDRTTPALDLTDLFNGFKPLFQALSPKDVNELSGEIVQVLQGEGGTVESLLLHTGSLTTTLAGRDKVIGEVIGNLNTVLKTVNGKGDALANLVSTLRQLVSGLAGDRAAIGDAISGIGALTESTAGLFEQARPPLKDSIAGLRDVAGTLAQNQSDVDSFLTNLPVKFNEIGRTASYGSWMNFFLCRATLEATPPRGVLTETPRCQS
ncbi:ABC transporter substrate-binding protein [Amycolatopsis mediterranei S699]|uniref:ABC transport system substrate-binding protein n=2 Tax=Amycolatopsis mediterranei TaxID=33910 RepID=A0A0H3D069_AMYMU|nr:MCE family protein [Amycolatopsis mediterranei]ADJ43589.1 ABC transport system substrate-binding protein [Amycolatopsis mediterranei U32]AEK40295.1 ABC transporter substrate-binding protein [Amycolatopsis mediterranei S699]AFO75301.1 ABC transporter substrate-binding protein [Amycolatopsis mediterranei S699]AGT82430.1 ABC transporter substrate-binding protein [Amycolatopsis mediterranei RB]KDO03788.1 ABC transporter substrate-binding protein [Amycolatopsis mediterranei]